MEELDAVLGGLEQYTSNNESTGGRDALGVLDDLQEEFDLDDEKKKSKVSKIFSRGSRKGSSKRLKDLDSTSGDSAHVDDILTAEPDEWQCSYCGYYSLNDQTFCTVCGRPQGEVPEKEDDGLTEEEYRAYVAEVGGLSFVEDKANSGILDLTSGVDTIDISKMTSARAREIEESSAAYGGSSSAGGSLGLPSLPDRDRESMIHQTTPSPLPPRDRESMDNFDEQLAAFDQFDAQPGSLGMSMSNEFGVANVMADALDTFAGDLPPDPGFAAPPPVPIEQGGGDDVLSSSSDDHSESDDLPPMPSSVSLPPPSSSPTSSTASATATATTATTTAAGTRPSPVDVEAPSKTSKEYLRAAIAKAKTGGAHDKAGRYCEAYVDYEEALENFDLALSVETSLAVSNVISEKRDAYSKRLGQLKEFLQLDSQNEGGSDDGEPVASSSTVVAAAAPAPVVLGSPAGGGGVRAATVGRSAGSSPIFSNGGGGGGGGGTQVPRSMSTPPTAYDTAVGGYGGMSGAATMGPAQGHQLVQHMPVTSMMGMPPPMAAGAEGATVQLYFVTPGGMAPVSPSMQAPPGAQLFALTPEGGYVLVGIQPGAVAGSFMSVSGQAIPAAQVVATSPRAGVGGGSAKREKKEKKSKKEKKKEKKVKLFKIPPPKPIKKKLKPSSKGLKTWKTRLNYDAKQLVTTYRCHGFKEGRLELGGLFVARDKLVFVAVVGGKFYTEYRRVSAVTVGHMMANGSMCRPAKKDNFRSANAIMVYTEENTSFTAFSQFEKKGAFGECLSLLYHYAKSFKTHDHI